MNNELEELLKPMYKLLDDKNIIKGISIVSDEEKLYVCFKQKELSELNQYLLFKIAEVYADDIFFSNDIEHIQEDKFFYWAPEGYRAEEQTAELRSRLYAVLPLNKNDKLTILGTSIMLANFLQEQDPLEINKQKDVYSNDDLKRHDHYIENGCPDKKWLYVCISLNKDNPLSENPYAKFLTCVDINSPISNSSNIIVDVLVGYEEKTYLTFDMDKENLVDVIKEYIKKLDNVQEQNSLSENIRKLLPEKLN